MSLSVIYVRVSTEDQVDFSPDAQAARCREYCAAAWARTGGGDFGPGFHGSDVLIGRGCRSCCRWWRLDRVAHVIVWRLDRLSRDTGDQSYLVRLFDRQGVRSALSQRRGDRPRDGVGRLHVGISRRAGSVLPGAAGGEREDGHGASRPQGALAESCANGLRHGERRAGSERGGTACAADLRFAGVRGGYAAIEARWGSATRRCGRSCITASTLGRCACGIVVPR